ncbi:hypothetical protein JYT25_00070 [bacterium AH-315-C20]|nr:hypothetical protein [bacterium AH-315-C20]
MKTIVKSMGLIGLLFTFNPSYTQPSDSDIKARVLRDGAKTVEFYGTGKVYNKITETYYMRSFEATWDTDYPGVTQRVSIEYKYNKSGSGWSFTKEFVVKSLYDGIPNPTNEELMAMINGDMKEFLSGSYTDVVGEIESIKLADKPRWMWHTVSSVSVNFEAVYRKKMSSTEVSKVKQIHTIRLYSDGYKQPWKNFMGSKSGSPEILTTETYTYDELENMKTFYELQLDKEASALMAGLPKITIPAFKNTKEAIVYTYKMLREATYDEFKSYMYEMLSVRHFHREGSKILSGQGEKVFEDMKEIFVPRTAFKDQSCEHPLVKTDGETSMEFWNRDKSRSSRIVIHESNGKYEIRTLSIYVFVKDELISTCKSAPAQCGDVIATEKAVIPTYENGQRVEVKVNGNWIAGKITQRDQVFDNRYQVKRDDGKTLWYYTDVLRGSGGSSAVSSSTKTEAPASTSTTSTNSSGFEIGEKVEVAYKGKKHQGTIEKVDPSNPNRYFVRTSTMSSMWHNSDILSKAAASDSENSPSTTESEKKETEKKETEKKKIDTNKAGGLKGKLKKIGG